MDGEYYELTCPEIIKALTPLCVAPTVIRMNGRPPLARV